MLVEVQERLEDALTKLGAALVAVIVCPSFFMGEAEQSNKFDSSACSQIKSGKICLEVVFCWCRKNTRNARNDLLFLVILDSSG